MGDRESESPHSTCDAGELTREDPAEGRGRSAYGTIGGKGAWDSEPNKRLDGTPVDSETGSACVVCGVVTGALHAGGCATAI